MGWGLAATLIGPTVVLAQAVSQPPMNAQTALGGVSHPASPREPGSVPLSVQPQRANFLGQAASIDARRVADWVAASNDNGALPFVVIDKVQARVFVFDSAARLRGASFALLGRARGDDTVPGIGDRKLSTIRPEERTTPAGRFLAVLGRDLKGDILWVDYDAAIALHRVVTGDPGDHRLQRLATTSPHDKRISYGCINVPARFYDDVVLGALIGGRGMVYILPETRSVQAQFAMSKAAAEDRP